MSSRDTILQRIRSGLANAAAAGFADLREPPVPEVWPRTDTPVAALVEKFSEELRLLSGEPIFCSTMEEARRQLCELVRKDAWPRLGCLDRPLARELTEVLARDEAAWLPSQYTSLFPWPSSSRIDWVSPDWTAERIEQLPAGLITADALLADTGSCVVRCATAAERLMCYLPPICVVVARVEQIAEHLPAAWEPIAKVCHAQDSRGETVLITGPSRTADIEKKLILGVHGPKRLIVLVVG